MLRTLIVSLLLAPALAAAAGKAPRLESLQIEIWPEYDRPAALVILKGDLGADAALPAALALRIPAASGGPGAVAYAADKAGPLFNLPYDRSTAAGFITLRFSVPNRFFHVEFYDPIATGQIERSYRYVWPGDFAVAALDVVVQEPAAAAGVSVEPELAERSTGTDGLRYRSAKLGPAAPGKALPVEIRYTKSDPRTSVEILKAAAPAPGPQVGTSSEEREAFRMFLVTGVIALLVTGASLVYFLWWRRRERPAAGGEPGAKFCGKCGGAAAPGDRFCAKCGAALG